MNDVVRKSSNDWKTAGSNFPMIGTSCWMLVLLLLVVSQAAFAQSSTRGSIVFADFEQVFTNYYKTKLANDQLQDMSDSINREQAKMLLRFDQLQKEFKEYRDQALADGLSETNRMELRKEADTRLIELRRQEERIKTFNESQQKKWEEQNARIRSGLVQDIREKIKVFGTAKGYRAIVDSAQVNEKGVYSVLFYDEKADVTQDVIKQINR
jgi:Skp family chaperone for outer membrane proteins